MQDFGSKLTPKIWWSGAYQEGSWWSPPTLIFPGYILLLCRVTFISLSTIPRARLKTSLGTDKLIPCPWWIPHDSFFAWIWSFHRWKSVYIPPPLSRNYGNLSSMEEGGARKSLEQGKFWHYFSEEKELTNMVSLFPREKWWFSMKSQQTKRALIDQSCQRLPAPQQCSPSSYIPKSS